MKTLLTLLSAALVALIGLVGQFFISNRKFIPSIREERTKAYADFLSACLTGMNGVIIEQGILDDLEKPDGIYAKEDHDKMRNHVSEVLKNYNSEINRTLSYMQIVSPEYFANLGRILMQEISDYREDLESRTEMELAYSNFTMKAHLDIKSLKEQSTSWRSIFSINIKELKV
ncbi:MAG TPA: hypothetical protein VMV58_00840 [Desulfosporosinus sp.]|nr:hypothetical protein [Desulfosporosinus sp.]